MKKILSSLSILLLLAIPAGCTDSKPDVEEQEDERIYVNGDIREETASVDTLPTFLQEKEEDMQSLYKLAATHEEVLKYIPCYCGCGESAGHESNYECFVHEHTGEKVVWDDHGTKCTVCLEIAAEAIIMTKDGHDVKDIRQYIDKKYEGEEYPPPTNTPMPS